MESLTKYFGPFVKKILEANIAHNLSIFLSLLCSILIFLKFGLIISVLSFLMLLLILSIIIKTIYTYYIKKKEDKKFLESFTDLEKFTIYTFISAESTSICSNKVKEYVDKLKNYKYSTLDDFWNGLKSLENKDKASYYKISNLENKLEFRLDPKVFEFFRNQLNN